ncbi:MAG: YkgJ family cysteine cluster protein [Planctomycetota bacterium]
MSIFDFTRKNTQNPWYIAGLAFECTECGRCCQGPEEGFVWATDDELDAIAKHLNMSPAAFRKKYVRKVGRRRSLKEKHPSHDCIFLRPSKEGGLCEIYPVRPTQCRTWPFWRSNLMSPYAWGLAGERCPGINRGKLFSFEEIEERANATRE